MRCRVVEKSAQGETRAEVAHSDTFVEHGAASVFYVTFPPRGAAPARGPTEPCDGQEPEKGGGHRARARAPTRGEGARRAPARLTASVARAAGARALGGTARSARSDERRLGHARRRWNHAAVRRFRRAGRIEPVARHGAARVAREGS